MQRHRHKTKHPSWVRLAITLAGGVVLALFLPLALGIFFDVLTGSSPLGLLLGMSVGMLIALIIVLRTIRNRLLVLSPIVNAEDNKESL
jgi:F0F1-type ATP synthase assembly protein I